MIFSGWSKQSINSSFQKYCRYELVKSTSFVDIRNKNNKNNIDIKCHQQTI